MKNWSVFLNIRFYFVIVLLVTIWLVLKVNIESNKIESYRKLYLIEKSLNDSMENILYSSETELNRFQVAYKIMLSKNPECAIEYGNIIANETK